MSTGRSTTQATATGTAGASTAAGTMTTTGASTTSVQQGTVEAVGPTGLLCGTSWSFAHPPQRGCSLQQEACLPLEPPHIRLQWPGKQNGLMPPSAQWQAKWGTIKKVAATNASERAPATRVTRVLCVARNSK